MQRSIKDILKVVQLLAPVSYSADTKTSGVDLQDAGACTLVVNVGATSGNPFSGTHKVAVTVQHADVDTDASYADVASTDLYSTESGAIAKNLDATDDASAVHLVHYRGAKRYVRLNLVETGTVVVPLSVSAILGNLKANPLS